ncbi:hypothetical protein GALMADRAFT_240022 [Galerina marginata CBS 339.88]|uniref:Uncharacterized protein n=1 Tax=Galerina marginata (strain CBS 339.88) TaxID=685588 RepID=A0A067TS48_GALM3|nr:hypothetical protein GALMADRAFT_240022 [Galerina marginata CBS 339.88]
MFTSASPLLRYSHQRACYLANAGKDSGSVSPPPSSIIAIKRGRHSRGIPPPPLTTSVEVTGSVP